MKKTGEISLVNLSVRDIFEQSQDTVVEVFGNAVRVPGSNRMTFIRGRYELKLGIDGQHVEFEVLDEDHYRVYVPEFRVIGKNNIQFETVMEQNGLLSVVTDQIDAAKMASDALNSDGLQIILEQNREILEASTIDFYTQLATGLGLDAKLEFIFAS
jgi:hypothetical protein